VIFRDGQAHFGGGFWWISPGGSFMVAEDAADRLEKITKACGEGNDE
jgi:hypothetical protein